MSGIHAFGAAVRYSWTRVRRTWWLPAAVAGGLATGWLTVTQVMTGTGVGVLRQAAQFLAFLQVGIMVLAGLAADPEQDEDSAAVLWSWPADTAALVLGKLVGAAPLALLAALGAALPPAVKIVLLDRAAGLPGPVTVAQCSLLLGWILSGAAWAWAVGSALGLALRGLPLLAALLATWLAGILAPYVFQALFNPFFPVAWLLQWTGSGMLPDDFWNADWPAIAGDLPLLLAHRALYLAAAGAVLLVLAFLYRRRRSVGAGSRWGLRLAAGVLVLATLGLAGGARAVLYSRADAARQELFYYARQGRLSPWDRPRPDQPPAFAVSRYQLDVDVRRPPELRVEARLRLENRGRAAVADPTLTLRHAFHLTRLEVAEPAAGHVRAVREGDQVRLEGLVLPPGGAATVDLAYHGRVDQWLFPQPYPPRPRSATSMFVPSLWRGAHVASYGLNLPPSYGWYPLPGAVTLARAVEFPSLREGSVPGGLWLDEGSSGPLGIPQWAGPFGPEPPPSREDLRTHFRVRVRHGARYPVLSNLAVIETPRGPATTMEGTTAFLELVGRPLARRADADAEIWYPQANPRSGRQARVWASWLRTLYGWFGEPTVPRVIILPNVGSANIQRLHLDPEAGVLIAKGGVEYAWTEAVHVLLLGARERTSPAEQCLIEVLAGAVAFSAQAPEGIPVPAQDRAAGPEIAGDRRGGPPSPCQQLAEGPRPEEIQAWIRQAPRPQVEAGLQRLRQLAAQRPLEARDLREVMGR